MYVWVGGYIGRRVFGLMVKRKTGDEHAAALCEVLDELLGREIQTEGGEGLVKEEVEEAPPLPSAVDHGSSEELYLNLLDQ